MKKYDAEILELKHFHQTLDTVIPMLTNELSQLIGADQDVVLLLYSRRSLEIIVRDICEKETIKISDNIPLKGIIDKLNKEQKAPSNIITAMQNLNSSSVFGAHPKEFDSGQVRTALINLTSILKWFVEYIGSSKSSSSESVFQTELISANQSQKQLQKSIVVLPFVNMSSDPEQEYFCDGIAEEIINSLTHISELKVIARTSAFSFKNQNVDVREIGRKLDVNYLLEGSVRKGGNKLRITAQLINLTDGSHLYSDRFDRELKDIFEIQDEITLSIVDKLKLKLLNRERNAVLKRYTNNNEVYNLYLLGRYHNYMFTKEEQDKAKEYYKKALKINPDFAPAYVGMGFYYLVLGAASLNVLPNEESIPLAKKYFLKALELDPEYAEAHSNLSFIYDAYDLEMQKGDYHAKRALEIEPQNAEVQRYCAWNQSFQGNPKEAVVHIENAIKLDPLAVISYQNAAGHYYFAGDLEESINYSEKALKLNPYFTLVNLNLGMAYLKKGMYNKAIEILENLNSGPGWSEPYLGFAYAITGRKEDTKKMLVLSTEYYEKKLVSASGIALVHLGLGNYEKVIELVEASILEKPAYSWSTALIKADSIWDPIRTHPEFQKILKKIWKNG